MRIEFVNGTAVHRIHSDGGGTELLAVFQYDADAEAFAKAQGERDATRGWSGCSYAVFNSYSAKLKQRANPDWASNCRDVQRRLGGEA